MRIQATYEVCVVIGESVMLSFLTCSLTAVALVCAPPAAAQTESDNSIELTPVNFDLSQAVQYQPPRSLLQPAVLYIIRQPGEYRAPYVIHIREEPEWREDHRILIAHGIYLTPAGLTLELWFA